MAQAVQGVTLSMTLPISCQICLGKVRRPVICCNHHVFCSACMEMWMQKSRQCPTCRVAITPDNPCREIIGATDESHASPSASVRKHLRRTRMELLLQEYEDEVESLQQENEELRKKKLKLEAELEEALRPGSAGVPHSETPELEGSVLKETENRLRAASELYVTVSQDLDKLRDANKNLRSQNVDLIQENVRLRGEVESRSPQKFGRYTVAALEAKITQYERDVRRLRKALERSDSYIEELEEQALRNPRNPGTPGPDPESMGGLTPPTPSSALAGLNLDTPVVHGEEGPTRPAYLRRLSFDACGGFTAPSSLSSGGGARRRGGTQSLSSAEEARMDVAFLDKVSELDCMMAEGEGSQGRTGAELSAESRREEREGGAGVPESPGETVKRRCSVGLVMSSPSKVSKIK